MRLRNITMIAFLSLLFTGGLYAQLLTEDFDGGIPADWSSVEAAGDGTETAVWTHTTTGPSGGFAVPAITSTTADNGWMLFDSDLNCSGNQDAWLISPEIDAAGVADVWIQFESYYRSFNDRPQIRVGTDMNDLTSWEVFEIFPNVSALEFAPDDDPALNPQNVNVNITDVAAGQTFRFAFQFLSNDDTSNGGNAPGCGYSWQIDDVVVIDFNPLPAIDLRVNQFHAVAPNAITPRSQVEAFGFMADIENVGSGDVNASELTASIQDNLGNIVFSEQIDYGLVPNGETNENVFFPSQFAPPAEAAIYEGSYVLTPTDGDDANPEDNRQDFIFEIGDTIFSKGLSFPSGLRPGANTVYTYGNIYHTPNGSGMYARYAQFSYSINQGEDIGEESVVVYLYQWAGDTNGDGQINQGELLEEGPGGSIILALNEYQFNSADDGQLITIPISLDNEAIPLDDNAYYFICVAYSGASNMFISTSDEYDYGAMRFMTDSLTAVTPLYASALDVGETGDYSLTGFGSDVVPLVNMSIGNNPDMDGPALVSTREIILAEGTVSVFPNPANETASIKFDLGETSDNVTVELFDVAGKLVKTAQYENVLNNTVTLDVKNLVNGAYLLQARTDKGIRTVNVTVQH